MTKTIVVTEAQVKAAQMLLDRDRAVGRPPDPATRQIAEARPRRPAGSGGAARPGTVRFWELLNDAEREALRAVASWETYAAGTRLVTQGDKADHVIVILGGRAKISVEEDGRERVVAVRGLGQLVGERGAHQDAHEDQAKVRSATMTALEMVWALAVRSEDFAAFLRNHPRVLGILDEQIYRRLTERSARSGEDFAPQRPPGRQEALSGENCTVMLFYVVEADQRRTTGDRLLIREALWRMTAEALQGIPGVWSFESGDGLLTVVPPSIPTTEVMARILRELPGAIERHNSSHHASANFQLQLAVNVGPVFGDAGEVSGEAIDVASLLLEAPHFKQAIVDSSASLGIIISPFIYETFIRPGSDLNEVASYTQTPVEIRKSSTTAWMRVIPPNLANSLAGFAPGCGRCIWRSGASSVVIRRASRRRLFVGRGEGASGEEKEHV
jgi:CRP-like cAMP-binding protein